MVGMGDREYTAPAAGVWLQIKVTSWGHYLSSTAAKVCRYYTCCLHIIALGWEPHTQARIHTHDRVHTPTHTHKQNKSIKKESQHTGRPHTKFRHAEFVHIFSPLNHKHTHRRTQTHSVIARLAELKQMKELVNEIWLNSLKMQHCSAASISRTKRQYFSKLPQEQPAAAASK